MTSAWRPMFIGVMLLAGCRDGDGQARLDQARDTWHQTRPDSYALTLVATGMAGSTYRSVHVPSGTSSAVLDDLFKTLERDLDAADEVEVSYDPVYGFPMSVRVDEDKNAIDDEHSYGIRNFRILTAGRPDVDDNGCSYEVSTYTPKVDVGRGSPDRLVGGSPKKVSVCDYVGFSLVRGRELASDDGLIVVRALSRLPASTAPGARDGCGQNVGTVLRITQADSGVAEVYADCGTGQWSNGLFHAALDRRIAALLSR